MSIINSQPLIGASGQGGAYNLTRSLRFRSSASAYLNRTPSSAGNRQTFTLSKWIKRGTLGANSYIWGAETSGGVNGSFLYFTSSDTLQFYDYASGAYQFQLITTQVFRDPSAWYHIVVVSDTTQATAANRIKMYVNGVQVTSFGTATYPSQNYSNSSINNANVHYVGYTASVFDGYRAEFNFIDGQQLEPSSFGETDTATGVWKPKKYTGTYGTNGFYLKFDNLTSTSTLGNDSSGNSNTWTVNNISLTSGSTYDSMKDVPTLTDADTANYCVLNALQPSGTGLVTPTNGNLTCAIPTNNNTVASIVGTIGVTSGKWYYEFRCPESKNLGGTYLGMGYSPAMFTAANQYVGNSGFGYGFLVPDTTGTYQANARVNGTNTGIGTAFTAATTDVFMVAADFDNGRMWLGRNGTWLAGDPAAGTGESITGIVTTSPLFPAAQTYRDSSWNNTVVANFGQQPFAYTPPSGFKALNTFNLPTPTIGATASTQANKYFDATLYTGNGSTLSVTNAGSFKPDLVWGKSRNNTYNHALVDSNRGVSKWLGSNSTNDEINTSGDFVTAFNSNGFSLGSAGVYNANTTTYVAWQWQAGQGSTSSNTAGSITSTVSANTTAGFSIVTYTGTGANATVGHGLGVAPSMIIVKRRSTSGSNWITYHSSLANPSGNYLSLNTTDAAINDNTAWNNTNPTSSVFSLGTLAAGNLNTGTFVAYCFAEVAGYSKFGSYTGNGSTDGTFVFTGFRPRYLLVKRTDTTSQWSIWDTARNTINAAGSNLWADSSEAETTSTSYDVDFLSNGFKLRNSNAARNANGGTYIFAAFADTPFKYSLGR